MPKPDNPFAQLITLIANCSDPTEAYDAIGLWLEQYTDFISAQLAAFNPCLTGDCPHSIKWDCYKGLIKQWIEEA